MSDTIITWDDPRVRDDLAALRASRPLVWGITNFIAAPLNANVLLAVEASAAIGAIEASAAGSAAIADGLWINLAAVTFQTPGALISAARSARDHATPWVFDPVSYGGPSVVHNDTAHAVLEARPTVIRGNASEIITLAGSEGKARGVDSTAAPRDAVAHATRLSERFGSTVAISGPTDLIVTGERVTEVPGGHVWLTRVTGAGCSLGALIAAFTAVQADPHRAAASAHAVYARAAEQAATVSRGTGSFAVALLDELTNLGVS